MIPAILFFILLVATGCSTAPQQAPVTRPAITDCRAVCGFAGVDIASVEQGPDLATALNCTCKR
jgi:hypothetical protein